MKNSIGELCQDKKKVLEIENLCIEGIGLKTPKQVKILHGKVQKYRNWLLQLSVCDPACGSGALLNAALDFLKIEHDYINGLEQKIHENHKGLPQFHLEYIEKDILEKQPLWGGGI